MCNGKQYEPMRGTLKQTPPSNPLFHKFTNQNSPRNAGNVQLQVNLDTLTIWYLMFL